VDSTPLCLNQKLSLKWYEDKELRVIIKISSNRNNRTSISTEHQKNMLNKEKMALVCKKYKDLIVKEPVAGSKNGQTITEGVAAIITKNVQAVLQLKSIL
jgi:hypothetical protein